VPYVRKIGAENSNNYVLPIVTSAGEKARPIEQGKRITATIS